MSLRSVRNSVVQRARNVVRRAGYDIVRRPVDVEAPAWFYQPSSSCQIPTLAFLYELFIGQRNDGTFVEVGAFDGESFSNTSCLADAGWRGVYVEPIPEFAERCRARHHNNRQVSIVNAAIGDTTGRTRIAVGGPLSTVCSDVADEYQHISWAQQEFATPRTLDVPLLTLNRLLEDERIQPGFDVLSIDVEGYEEAVFSGFDLDRWRPHLLIVELADTHSELTTKRSGHAALSRRICSARYGIVYKDAINTMFADEGAWNAAYGMNAPRP